MPGGLAPATQSGGSPERSILGTPRSRTGGREESHRTLIEARGLTKSFGDRTAIADVSFSVGRGEIVGFLGPNGAGKTTTMRILTGYFPPTSGTGTVAGFDIFRDSLAVRERIGYLPETPPLYREMTVVGYLDFVARIRGVRGAEVPSRIDEVVSTCALEDVALRLIGNLSKGYKQRVGLAQALIHHPDVLVLDEPTVGLDPKQIIEIRELIKGLRGQRTIVLSTHILPEVSQICERAIVIHRGRVVATDTLVNLEASLRKTERVRVTVKRDPPALLKDLRAIDGVSAVSIEKSAEGTARDLVVEMAPGKDVREDIARVCVATDAGLVELAALRLSLEDVFLELTTREEATA